MAIDAAALVVACSAAQKAPDIAHYRGAFPLPRLHVRASSSISRELPIYTRMAASVLSSATRVLVKTAPQCSSLGFVCSHRSFHVRTRAAPADGRMAGPLGARLIGRGRARVCVCARGMSFVRARSPVCACLMMHISSDVLGLALRCKFDGGDYARGVGIGHVLTSVLGVRGRFLMGVGRCYVSRDGLFSLDGLVSV